MITIKNTVKGQYEVKKSEFISYAFCVLSEDDVKKNLADIRSEYADARHICYAYVLNGHEKCSDDGEPTGTAGKPLLDLIKNKGYTNLLLVVVRYFGGIKLGAGGLYRAYIASGLTALDLCTSVQLIEGKKFSIKLSYENLNENLVKLNDFSFIDKQVRYSDSVVIEGKVSNPEAVKIAKFLTEYNISYEIHQIYLEEQLWQ